MAPSIELSRIQVPPYSGFLVEDPIPADIGDAVTAEDDVLADIHPQWRRDLHALLEYPKSSTSAVVVHMFVTFLILFSALVTILETVPALHVLSTRAWFGVETSIIAIFTLEYGVRCLAWSGSWVSLLKWQTCTYLSVIFSTFGPLIIFISVLRHYRPTICRSVLYRNYVAKGYGTSFIRIARKLWKLSLCPVCFIQILHIARVSIIKSFQIVPIQQHNITVSLLYFGRL